MDIRFHETPLSKSKTKTHGFDSHDGKCDQILLVENKNVAGELYVCKVCTDPNGDLLRNIQNIQNVVWDRNEWNSDDWNLNKEISKNRGRIFNQNFFLNINEKREISYEFVPSFQSAVNDQKNYHLGYFIEDYKQLFENHEMEFKINLYEKAIKTYLINYLETYRIKEEENEEEIQEEHERVEFENILQ
jgi:hypothetical protein